MKLRMCVVWICGLTLLFSSLAFSGPFLYVNPYDATDSMAIKNDIDLLADYGLISAPVLTWPLPWKSIGSSLLSTESELTVKEAPSFVQLAYFRVLARYKKALSRAWSPGVFISGGSKLNPFRTFQWQPRSDFEVGGSLEKQNQRIAANLAVNYGKYADVTGDVHLDSSYFYLFLGNWGIGVDKMSRWWGPGFTDSMILSANAPPLPTLTLQRMGADAFETKWLSWLGPWLFTTSLSVGGDDVPIAHPLIWLTNVSLRPLQSLQLSFSRVSFFAGETRPLNQRMLWNLIKVDNNCNSLTQGQEYCNKYSPGTEHWEFTMDWNLNKTFNFPANLYLQTIFNDRVPYSYAPWLYRSGFNPPIPGRTAFLAGSNIWFPLKKALVRLYGEFEYTFQHVYYFWGPMVPQIYGYSKYPYVYYGKNIGSSLGDEAMGYSLGGIINESNGTSDTFLIRYIKLYYFYYQNPVEEYLRDKVLWVSLGKTFPLPNQFGQVSTQLGYLSNLKGVRYKSSTSGFLVWSKKF
ncbi:capsule assembly Wzi family protein [Legionella impletisoli]|nr:capsule assembly Wzi family protein [Legionella impletisoli]